MVVTGTLGGEVDPKYVSKKFRRLRLLSCHQPSQMHIFERQFRSYRYAPKRSFIRQYPSKISVKLTQKMVRWNHWFHWFLASQESIVPLYRLGKKPSVGWRDGGSEYVQKWSFGTIRFHSSTKVGR